MLKYDEQGNIYDDGQPNFSWVDNNVEPLKITVNKRTPEWVDATPQPLLNPDASPADIAAYRLNKSVKRDNPLPVQDVIIPEQPQRPSYIMEPDLQEAQGGMHFPPGLMQDDAGRFYYADDPTKTVPMVKRPGLLPIASTPEGPKLVMPKLLDLASNVISGGVAAKVPLKAGEMALGSGAMRTVQQAEPFYSALEKAVQNAKVQKADASQWLGYLKNQPGVKSEEINTVLHSLPEGQITKTQLEDLVKANKVELKEKVLTDNYKNTPEYEKLKNQGFDEDQIKKMIQFNANTKYSAYQLPGGENYKEMLLTHNPQFQASENYTKYINKLKEKYGDKPYGQMPLTDHEKFMMDNFINKYGEGPKSSEYQSSHWDEPNVLAHIRMNDRTIEGKKVLHMEEAQSDIFQAGRKQGYKGEKEKLQPEFDKVEKKIIDSNDENIMGQPKIEDALKLAVEKKLITETEAKTYKRYTDIENGNPVPDFPFKNSWRDLIAKRMIRKAAEEGYDAITWPKGENVSTNPKLIGNPKADDSFHRMHYNEMMPQSFNNVGKKYGSKVGEKEIGIPHKAGVQGQDIKLHHFPITDGLRKKALNEGFNLFSSAPILTPVTNAPELVDNKKKYRLVPVQGNPLE